MNLSSSKKFSLTDWYNKLKKSQKLFFYVFWINLLGFVLVVDGIINSLLKNGEAYLNIDKFTNQSNVLLLIFSTFYVFMPKHSFIKNDKFLIATTTYILFTFVGYNFILNFMGDGYATKTNFHLFKDIYVHFFNPVLFIISAFVKFVLDPNPNIKKFHSFLIPGMIYPIIYAIYLASIPFVYHNQDGMPYSVYGSATNTKTNPKIAWPIIILMLSIYFPLTYFLIWFGAKKISAKYILKNTPVSLKKKTIKFIVFKLPNNN
ncbi:DUF1600 domain-containing protein [Mycoplasma sp. E35C]|uniref:DUF1600 domain-containing protein n=1 Tax=Mycoplasma sp. E35C TaxID=2801918 RepID=UPI001CA393B2|nr:DUF1600 domain-containing protein [Mycoplasma sp. E35C]QZX48996.1 DUF1600 domain-containing protein [Mycoplasma sp. E35C]